jgi:hypothetical protein
LETEPPHFVAWRHHLGEEYTEAGIAHNPGKRDEEGLDVELPSQLEQVVSKGGTKIASCLAIAGNVRVEARLGW